MKFKGDFLLKRVPVRDFGPGLQGVASCCLNGGNMKSCTTVVDVPGENFAKFNSYLRVLHELEVKWLLQKIR